MFSGWTVWRVEGKQNMKRMLKERIWFFDFDGTLSPIVRDRDQAELHPVCRKML